jgi:beta-lactamase regulating signal transducer with metallopeptidase domain
VIAGLVLYSVTIDFLFALVALGIDRLLGARGYPRRGIWLFALSVSVASTLMPYWTMHTAQTDVSALYAESSRFVPEAFSHGKFIEPIAVFGWPQVNAFLGEFWVVTCALFVVFNIWQGSRLMIASHAWRRTVLESTVVWISDRVGPAVVGFCWTRVVIPRWLLSADLNTRALAIAHEREHIRRHDQLLFLIGLTLLSVMPWNPALSWQLRRLSFAIEVDCDSRVVSSRPARDRCAYAEALLRLWQNRYPGATFLRDPDSEVQRRIRILLAR